MENESKIGRFFQSISDKIQDQAWFQQLKVKWDELDAKTKMVAKYLGLIGSSVLIVVVVGSSLYAVADKKREIDDKQALAQKIQSSQDELRKLKDITSRFNGAGEAPWPQFLQERATAAGFDPSLVQVTSEKIISVAAPKEVKSKDPKALTPQTPAAAPEESLVETSLKKVNVRQLVKFVQEVENGGRTVKVRRLQIDTNPDESGYLDATVVVSAFRLKQP
ncbi:MAG: hypothetical protein H7301_06310 [Cryobacterium sp.]|nr:hypothetical protein [Oligoflexia bacterium]